MKSIFKVNGKPFFTIGGQTHNSSTYSEDVMKKAWLGIEALGLNTIAAPICWGQIEPEEDLFDFSQIDMILDGARKRNVKVVLLWFGTWKNGTSHYVPKWVKTQKERFVWAETAQNIRTRTLSPLCEATKEADKKAYLKVIEYLKKVNTDDVVLSVQIENEPGSIGTPRDYSKLGETAFSSNIPEELYDWLEKLSDCPIKRFWTENGSQKNGTWEEVFGIEASPIFTSYYTAIYINEISKAGKEIYDIPTYVNVWIGEMYQQIAGVDYPSGGPTTKTIDLWKFLTPDIDAICPDIYLQDYITFDALCEAYSRDDNIFYIPESAPSVMNALNVFMAIEKHNLSGIHTFGIDSVVDKDGVLLEGAREWANTAKILSSARPLIEKYLGTGKIYAVAQFEGSSGQSFDFGDYIGKVTYSMPLDKQFATNSWGFMDTYHREPEYFNVRGKGLIIYEGNGSFYLAGEGYKLVLIKKDTIEGMTTGVRQSVFLNTRHQEYLSVSEGYFDEDDNFITVKERCGDESDLGLWVHHDIGVVHVQMDN
ncbi:MAG: DUF5597 domain-containing protein [Clostridiales bacterium]|jgi:beta-galactosidase GanA|nr:DUF5597 domain-containing protein [Clostridiales bacterium]